MMTLDPAPRVGVGRHDEVPRAAAPVAPRCLAGRTRGRRDARCTGYNGKRNEAAILPLCFSSLYLYLGDLELRGEHPPGLKSADRRTTPARRGVLAASKPPPARRRKNAPRTPNFNVGGVRSGGVRVVSKETPTSANRGLRVYVNIEIGGAGAFLRRRAGGGCSPPARRGALV